MTTRSSQETKRFGEKFAHKIKNGGVVCLYGELGAGKTTLVQGIAAGLGVKRRIISPTFIIIRSYGRLYHIDLYRLDDTRNLGIEELWQDKSNILLIEWAEKIKSLLPKKHWEIKLEIVGETKRKISYEAFH